MLSLLQHRSLRQVPLRTKLVASVLVLVFAALVLISAGSTLALHNYLIGRMDAQLQQYAQSFKLIAQSGAPIGLVLPPDYYVTQTTTDGQLVPSSGDRTLAAADLPAPITGTRLAEVLDTPISVRSSDGDYWRTLVTRLPNGTIMQLNQRMSGVDLAVGRLVWVDVLVGSAVLIALAAVGAALVRQSLIPLVQIERTAAAIAVGDLTQRVPDPEPESREPTTELGRLSHALNAMLTQIEAAFTARAISEAAAREAAVAARESEVRAVSSEQKMRQFVADASHELRTPLTSIRGFAELYRQGAVPEQEDVAKLVRRIEDEAARMGLLVEDLLLLARLDRERPLTLVPVELPVLALEAVEAAQVVAPERTVELEILDEPEKLIAYGDDARLRQVVGNLMTNALVHTPPDAAVTLRLYALPGDRAVIEVADGGPGLTVAQRDRVFERFYRADEARTRRTDRAATGTGLGLAIVAAIVRAHHGTVEVLSEPGTGATFRVTLPAIAPESPTPG